MTSFTVGQAVQVDLSPIGYVVGIFEGVDEEDMANVRLPSGWRISLIIELVYPLPPYTVDTSPADPLPATGLAVTVSTDTMTMSVPQQDFGAWLSRQKLGTLAKAMVLSGEIHDAEAARAWLDKLG